MPPLAGFNPLESKSSGTVLLEGAEGGFWPVLTIGTHGKGRVLVLATDDSWKWYMGMVAKEKDHYAYLRLVERIVRWLTKDPGLDAVQIALPEKRGGVGEEVEFRVKAVAEVRRARQKEALSLSVRPSRAGANHPITFFPTDEAAQRNLWREMP
ncbi:MAG: Threonine dehydrogenase, partial [Deltaproteobacteria bacterium]|nr:Threonine dehydrogenase [Deltaproteobacteria bacterium]